MRTAATLALLALCGAFAFPFVWMVLATFKASPEIFRPLPLLPDRFHLDHYRALLDGTWIPFPRQFANSLIVATAQTLGALALSVPAAFVLARYRFRGAGQLYAISLASVFVPQQVLALPLYAWFHQLGLLDTLPAAILPGVASGLGILFFTQVFRRLPQELIELARSEGASEYRVFLTLLPLARNAILTFGLIHFVLAWHEHLIPLLMLSSDTSKTVPLALASLYGSSARLPYAVLMVGCLSTVLPTALLFLLLRGEFRSALRELVGG